MKTLALKTKNRCNYWVFRRFGKYPFHETFSNFIFIYFALYILYTYRRIFFGKRPYLRDNIWYTSKRFFHQDCVILVKIKGRSNWPSYVHYIKEISRAWRAVVSMTSLLMHNVAHSTRYSFRPKTNNQFLSLAFSWVKVVKNWTSF